MSKTLTLQIKTAKIIRELKKLFPRSRTALNWRTPWELLVATILAAQATDKKVNEITAKLFKKYPNVSSYTSLHLTTFQNDIRQIGLFRNKAKNIIAAAKIIKEKYRGTVPETMAELTELPGVGRKTANIILSSAFGKAQGIAVDTHVHRLTRLFGLTKENDPNKIEQDLMKIVPKKEWLQFNYRLVDYGRKFCPAHCKHKNCPLRRFIKKSVIPAARKSEIT